MSVNLRKPAKINLVKGQKMCLTKNAEKDGESINFAFVGANWSCLENGGSVDLDSSILMYDENKKLIDVVYYGHIMSKDGSIRHSGDDRCGDTNGNDGLDNEVIRINLKNLNPKVKFMVSILNNYTHQSFGEIPNIELRIYTNDSGKNSDIDTVLSSYKLDNNIEYTDSQAIILGHFYQHNGQWKFSADGQGSNERSIEQISIGSALDVL